LKLETKAVHAGRGVDPATGAVTPPIHLSTTFERDADGSYPRGYEYARESNPNRDALEECVRELEGGAAAAACVPSPNYRVGGSPGCEHPPTPRARTPRPRSSW
jgi:cystathionine beta-lyase/cystathionine gamma-synthase